jgi:hypothetical protein
MKRTILQAAMVSFLLLWASACASHRPVLSSNEHRVWGLLWRRGTSTNVYDGLKRYRTSVGRLRRRMWSLVRRLVLPSELLQVVPAVQWSVEPAKVQQRAQQAAQPQASHMRLCGDSSRRIGHRIYPAGHSSTAACEKKATTRPVGNRSKRFYPHIT